MRIAVLCPSEIAIRRFMPALNKVSDMEFVGVGVNSINERFGDEIPESAESVIRRGREKAKLFIDNYGGRVFESYEEVILSDEIDGVYIPLPPALHFKWALKAIKQGKHVLVEKPSATRLIDTEEMVQQAEKRNLALHENYMFIFHEQLDTIEHIIRSGEIGEARLYRITFGFPQRSPSDFRYNKELGGGALLDAGGYTIKYATRLLGQAVQITDAHMNTVHGFDVDIYGSGTLSNSDGVVAQIAFGMDNDYRCELEVWGSLGTLKTGRVLTAPAGYVPTVLIKKNTDEEVRSLPVDDAFAKSIEYFKRCVNDKEERRRSYAAILKQASLVEQFMLYANKR